MWLGLTALLVVLVTVGLFYTMARPPELGSQEDLGGQIDALDLPPSLIQLDESYVVDCPSIGPCPSLVRWYDTTAPAEIVRAEIISHMNAADVEVNENSVNRGIFVGRDDKYIYFVVLDTDMIAGNRHAPPGTKVEISIHVLQETQRL
jgi:hypothetical protein